MIDVVDLLRRRGVDWLAGDAECLVFTRKEGLLSRVAHDLKLRADAFRVGLRGTDTGAEVSADLDAASLSVVTAMRDGRDNPSALSAGDRDKIAAHIRADVLHTRQHPHIRARLPLAPEALRAMLDGGVATASGELTLHGQTRAVRLRVERAARQGADGWQATAEVHQPDFGIKPFSAMMGTLKVQANVTVAVWLARAPLEAALQASE